MMVQDVGDLRAAIQIQHMDMVVDVLVVMRAGANPSGHCQRSQSKQQQPQDDLTRASKVFEKVCLTGFLWILTSDKETTPLAVASHLILSRLGTDSSKLG